MAIRYGFFNSVGGDRKYNADDITKYFDKIVGDGVFHDPATALQVIPSSGMVVSISPGRGLIKCRWMENASAYNVTIPAAHVTLDRTDRIVMRLNLNESARKMEIGIITGTPYASGATPVIPPLSPDPLITELTLALVTVGHGATVILSDDITDTRGDIAYCGWVQSLISGSGGTLKKYQSYTRLSAETSSISIGIPQYRSGGILQVYVGGIMLTESIEYTVSGTGVGAVINLTNTIRAGNSITCVFMVME